MSDTRAPAEPAAGRAGAAPPLHLVEARRLPDEGRLRLTWSDGHSAELDYGYLRGWCPCAGCQGHGPTIRHRPPAGPVTPRSIEPVGNYAISILWSDGHGTGIYRFDYLRQICPCPQCGGVPGGEIAGR